MISAGDLPHGSRISDTRLGITGYGGVAGLGFLDDHLGVVDRHLDLLAFSPAVGIHPLPLALRVFDFSIPACSFRFLISSGAYLIFSVSPTTKTGGFTGFASSGEAIEFLTVFPGAGA